MRSENFHNCSVKTRSRRCNKFSARPDTNGSETDRLNASPYRVASFRELVSVYQTRLRNRRTDVRDPGPFRVASSPVEA